MILAKDYPLDSFRLFFPSGLKIFSHLRQYCPGSKNFKKNCTPLVYSEDVRNSLGLKGLTREHVLAPEYFSRKEPDLGWVFKDGKYFIPSEQMSLRVFIDPPVLKFLIIPQNDSIEQYHLEFRGPKDISDKESFMAFNLKYLDFQDLMEGLAPYTENSGRVLTDFKAEPSAASKDEGCYSLMPAESYCIDTSAFRYIPDFISTTKAKSYPPVFLYKRSAQEAGRMHPAVVKFGRLAVGAGPGKALCRVQVFFALSGFDAKDHSGYGISISEDKPLQDAPPEIYLKININDFINSVHTYNEKIGPICLW